MVVLYNITYSSGGIHNNNGVERVVMALVTSLNKFSSAKEEQTQPPPLLDGQVRSLAIKIYETVHGIRPTGQLARYVSPHIINQLEIQRALRTERATYYSKNLRVVPIPGRVTRSETTPSKIYCVVIMHTATRSCAITMCLEFFRFGWRATDVSLL